MYDSIVQIWDAVILLVLYALYIVIMVLNTRKLSQGMWKEAAAPALERTPVPSPSPPTSIGEHREVKHFKHDRRNSVLLALHDSKLSESSVSCCGAKSNGEAIKSKSGKDEVTAKQTSSSGANQEESKDAEDSNAERGRRRPDMPAAPCCPCCPDLRGAPPRAAGWGRRRPPLQPAARAPSTCS
uniref:Uncharacterized protein n=1 Tax=Macrostomum lignano TaxID=282301 RepID=A0A1I8FKK5_9PLAT